MAESCVYTPSRGKSLHRALTTKLGHDKGTEIFLRAINPNFISDFKNSLSLDSEGVPLFDSLMANKVIKTFIGQDNMFSLIRNSIGSKDFENTTEGWNEALNSAELFNNSSAFRKDYIVVPKIENDETIKLSIMERSPENEVKFKNYINGRKLKNSIKSYLHGTELSVESLDDITNGINEDYDTFSGISKALIALSNIKKALIDNRPLSDEEITDAINALAYSPYIQEPLVVRLKRLLQSEAVGADIVSKVTGEETEESELTDDDYDLVTAYVLLVDNSVTTSPLVQRSIDLIKEKLNNFKDLDALRTISDINNETPQFMQNLEEAPEVEEVESLESEELLRLENLINTLQKRIDDLKTIETKKVLLHNDSSLDAAKALGSSNLIEGLTGYLTSSAEQISEKVDQLNDLEEKPFEERCNIVKSIIDYVNSYREIISSINRDIDTISEELKDLGESGETIRTLREALATVVKLNNELDGKSRNLASIYFTEFIKPLIGDGIKLEMSKNGEDFESSIMNRDKDISIMSRWLDSASNSSDVLLQAAHKGIKKEKDKVRLRVIDLANRAKDLGVRSERAGLKDFSFMYELGPGGNRTGYYITKFSERDYTKARKEAFREIKKTIKGNSKAKRDQRKEAKEKWRNEHPRETFVTEEYSKLTTAQKNFYNEFMSIKRELDGLLPDNATTHNNAIRIRKGFYDRLTSLNSPTDIISAITKNMKDSIIERSDDDSFGNRESKTDLRGREIKTVPIYYVHSNPNEDLNDLTNDLIGALIAYGYMAHNYNAMHKIAGALELGRETLRERGAEKRRGEKVVEETIKGLGIEKVIPVKKEHSNIEDLYEDLLESQIYGIYLKDYGTIGSSPINKQKATSLVLRVGSRIQLGFNVLAGIANAVNGLAMQNIEATAGEFYGRKELAKADLYYGKHIGGLLAELGSRTKTNELDLIFDYFNIKQDFDGKVKGVDFNKRGLIKRIFGPSILYLLQTGGDHFLYGRAGIAMLMREQVMKDGKKMSLLDALSFEDINPDSPSSGRKVSIEGIKKLDGSDFTEDDVSNITRRIEKINQYCLGVYNKDDQNAARSTMAGRVLLQYRDWMRPALRRRFASTYKDITLDMEREGYYYTGYKFMEGIIKDLAHGKMEIIKNWKTLSDYKKRNLLRAAQEIGQYLLLLGVIHAVDWDDYEENWAMSILEYTLRRQATELGSIIPGPTMISEGKKILESPAACINVVDNTLALANLLWIPNYNDEIETGSFKGHSTAYKSFINSPLSAQYKNIYRLVHPEEGIPFLKQ